MTPLCKICWQYNYTKGVFKVEYWFNNKNSDKGVKMAKKMTIAKLVKLRTKYDLKDYCEMRGLSIYSLYNGYVAKRARKILERDGIKVA